MKKKTHHKLLDNTISINYLMITIITKLMIMMMIIIHVIHT